MIKPVITLLMHESTALILPLFSSSPTLTLLTENLLLKERNRSFLLHLFHFQWYLFVPGCYGLYFSLEEGMGEVLRSLQITAITSHLPASVTPGITGSISNDMGWMK